MDSWIIDLVAATRYWGVALLMFIETVFPPIPSEVIMTIAGVSAARGEMALPGVIASGTAGAMLGNYAWFWIARKWGAAWLHRVIDRYGRWLTMDWAEVERGEDLFRRHGPIIVLVARMLPTFRSLISVPAGLFTMSTRRFLVFSTIGTMGWSAALASTGYLLGNAVDDIERYLGPLSSAVIGLIIASYLWRLARWRPKS
jgi:membrane protein DedA with SNARE-associated domain